MVGKAVRPAVLFPWALFPFFAALARRSGRAFLRCCSSGERATAVSLAVEQIYICNMKRGMMLWDDEDSGTSGSDSSSTSGSDSEANKETGKKRKTIAKFAKKHRTFDYESLQKHGYKTAALPDIPSPEEKPDWSWSTGKDKKEAKEAEETYEERQKTRAALADGEKLFNVQTRSDRKNLSFSQREKRKREVGQASRGKNYVEEEKRLLRDSGVYSGFDS